MKVSRTAIGITTAATKADRTLNRNTRQMSVTMTPSWISVFLSVATEPRISCERS
jgi:hypothetical protein